MSTTGQVIGMTLTGLNTGGVGYLIWSIRGWTVKTDARLRYLEKDNGLYRGKEKQ